MKMREEGGGKLRSLMFGLAVVMMVVVVTGTGETEGREAKVEDGRGEIIEDDGNLREHKMGGDELNEKSSTDELVVATGSLLNETEDVASLEAYLCLSRRRESFFVTPSSLFTWTISPSSGPGGVGDGGEGKDEGDTLLGALEETRIKRIFQSDTNVNVSGEVNNLGQDWINYTKIPVDVSEESVFCNRSWDGLRCWPEIPEGYSVTVQCFASLNHIAYDTSRTVTRACKEGGVWEKTTNYSNCKALSTHIPEENDNWALETTTKIYFIGYSVTLAALILAVTILLSMEELHCVRNVIHTNLMLTYIFDDALWLISSLQSRLMAPNQGSCITFILLHYFHLTNFFWMLVEGLYLYFVVVKTFTARNIKLRMYIFIGWGLPLLVVIAWAIAKWMTPAIVGQETVSGLEPSSLAACKWLDVNMYDWIYKAPAIVVLATNMLFLLQIMWVLITKLRSATNPETQQKRKAAKAFVVLMPLLGITYILVLSGPKKVPLYEHIRAFLISMQGFLVALLYCFLNGEVRTAIRQRWSRVRGRNRWLRYICCCQCHRQGHTHASRNWSMQRSRTESIRLYNHCPGSTTSFCNQSNDGFLRPKFESPTSGGGSIATLKQGAYNLSPDEELGSGGDLGGNTPIAGNGSSGEVFGKVENGGKQGHHHQEYLDPLLLLSKSNGGTHNVDISKSKINGCEEMYA